MSERIVSFEDEPLVLVDSSDEPIGFASKAECHDGGGKLHRAFSVFLFDEDGPILLQQRAAQKRLWPGFWSNSCCSHPRRGEKLDEAARRRVREELGHDVALTRVYSFEYEARFRDAGTEHELCHVFVGTLDRDPEVNPNEIQDWQWVTPVELDTILDEEADIYSPWLLLEWERMRREFWEQIRRAVG